MDTALELTGIAKSYGQLAAVSGLDFAVPRGEVLALLGPSGCGKSTTLGIIAGFLKPDAGSVSIHGREVTGVPPERRNIGMVFQTPALFPHMTVFENVAFGLRMRKVPRTEVRDRVGGALSLVRLEGLADRAPRELSGGQAQRVALARALVIDPQMLLLDEPMSSLDANLRRELRRDLGELHQQTRTTTVLVTHDQHEALALADQIAVMRDGELQQIGPPELLMERPTNLFVAQFVGEANTLTGEAVEVEGEFARVRIAGSVVGARVAAGTIAAGAPVQLAVRPNDISVLPSNGTGVGLPARVVSAQRLVDATEYVIAVGDDHVVARVAGWPKESALSGDVLITWAQHDAVAFPHGVN